VWCNWQPYCNDYFYYVTTTDWNSTYGSQYWANNGCAPECHYVEYDTCYPGQCP
jgi:hypothetical protein